MLHLGGGGLPSAVGRGGSLLVGSRGKGMASCLRRDTQGVSPERKSLEGGGGENSLKTDQSVRGEKKLPCCVEKSIGGGNTSEE